MSLWIITATVAVTQIYTINENRYQAHIRFQGKQCYLGTFTTLEDAVKARCRGEEMHAEFIDRYYKEKYERNNNGREGTANNEA